MVVMQIVVYLVQCDLWDKFGHGCGHSGEDQPLLLKPVADDDWGSWRESCKLSTLLLFLP